MRIFLGIGRQPTELNHSVEVIAKGADLGLICFRRCIGEFPHIRLEQRLELQQFSLQMRGELPQDRAIWRDMPFDRTPRQLPTAAENEHGSGQQ